MRETLRGVAQLAIQGAICKYVTARGGALSGHTVGYPYAWEVKGAEP